jgi:hypothetical protein
VDNLLAYGLWCREWIISDHLRRTGIKKNKLKVHEHKSNHDKTVLRGLTCLGWMLPIDSS